MIRIQAQLTEEQRQALRRLAAAEGVSIAELLRRGADMVIRSGAPADRAVQWQRAMTAVGRFAGDESDVAEGHDRYLAEAFRR